MTRQYYCPIRLIRPNKFSDVTGNKIKEGFTVHVHLLGMVMMMMMMMMMVVVVMKMF